MKVKTLVFGITTIGLVLCHAATMAQERGWQHKDLKLDKVFGISTNRAYELLKGKKPKTLVVAVMDSGIDTTHEDLKPVLWVNQKEIPGNQKDDDRNGYVDDVHGWDFIGGKNGDVDQDNLEMTRLIREQRGFYDSLSYTSIPAQYRKGYQVYRKLRKDFEARLASSRDVLRKISEIEKGIDTVVSKIGKKEPSLKDVQDFKPANSFESMIRKGLIAQIKGQQDFNRFKQQLDDAFEHYQSEVNYQLNIDFDPRYIVGDNDNNDRERYYGNNDVFGPHALHGTHVAGIIAAVRNNGIGIDGIADDVKIMVVRVVPEGDERDKDVANGIRYAVDNGAKIINMSFGKSNTKDKSIVDDAVRYAMSKDVLIIHAAGNDGKDLDELDIQSYPNKFYEDGGEAGAWMSVGASGMKDDSTLVASFSNFGKVHVDVFAPGIDIYSCVPVSQYRFENGTSMAAPMVTGIAALIREYYPRLTALQVKDIIMRSVVKPTHSVYVIVNGKPKKVLLSDICVSGGVVNAYNALKLAAVYSNP